MFTLNVCARGLLWCVPKRAADINYVPCLATVCDLVVGTAISTTGSKQLRKTGSRRKMGVRRWGGMVGSIVQKKTSDPIMEEFTAETELSREDFKELLRKIDAGLRALPATAQVSQAALEPHQARGARGCRTAHYHLETIELPVSLLRYSRLSC